MCCIAVYWTMTYRIEDCITSPFSAREHTTKRGREVAIGTALRSRSPNECGPPPSTSCSVGGCRPAARRHYIHPAAVRCDTV